ncbi:hypothetical protein FIBSPDRAFT_904527 [Athelia psychrophila]|uniref:Uncharacterized protein n=1 Tax=Athelia psychrophila TaxID=1759441 RepID=A0A167UMH0_9AGAM|nr:hypothetical protein FIBSPDRAFT_904527 [Fibularhizoctonia sp. CBS 109695]
MARGAHVRRVVLDAARALPQGDQADQAQVTAEPGLALKLPPRPHVALLGAPLAPPRLHLRHPNVRALLHLAPPEDKPALTPRPPLTLKRCVEFKKKVMLLRELHAWEEERKVDQARFKVHDWEEGRSLEAERALAAAPAVAGVPVEARFQAAPEAAAEAVAAADRAAGEVGRADGLAPEAKPVHEEAVLVVVGDPRGGFVCKPLLRDLPCHPPPSLGYVIEKRAEERSGPSFSVGLRGVFGNERLVNYYTIREDLYDF